MSTLEPLRWLAASAELDRALELAPDQREEYLAALRARDARLAADVESLLDEHRELVATGLLTDLPASVSTGSIDVVGARPSGERSGPLLADPIGSTPLGRYRVVRTLGRGGMGTVYEADEIDSGRRVALKILNDRLKDPRERERFNREGRLAAAINHPHCVFVFAAVEVDGRLAIAMELMQGTLADRLKAQGPLSTADAVDATLQLLAGLQAASAIGILHRDVKPSNCFVGADGAVKIGDFGISLPLRSTEDTTLFTGTRHAATPAYASPEQLRGAPLDVRSDIYSLGATLYELLTGRRPLEANDLMSLLMAVANDTPLPPHARAPSVPRGLSQVVLRCLAKQPDQRFADYDALAAALQPYSSSAATPATVGRRFFAGFVDECLLMLVTGALPLVWWWKLGVPFEYGNLMVQVQFFLVLLAYFGIAESVWAATPGKALVGLSLVDSNGRSARGSRVLARAALFSAAWTTGSVLSLVLRIWVGGPTSGTELPWSVFFWSVIHSLLPLGAFFTARRRNGFAGWHDLLTETRIVERSSLVSVRAAPTTPAAPAPRAVRRLGSFDVADGAIAAMPAGWRPGFDDRLRRPVWIRELSSGAPPLDARRMSINRPTRLRWLAGRREADEAWDVFEAVPGLPLEEACARPRGWADLRWWLLDLARECEAQTSEPQPPLRAARVWVLDTGGAKLVDDPSGDRAEPGSLGTQGSCASLLLDVVRIAHGSSVVNWPLGAHQFVDSLSTDPPDSASKVVSKLESLTRQRAVVTRRWRALHVFGVAAVPLMLSASTTVGMISRAARPPVPREVQVVGILLTSLRVADQGDRSLSPKELEPIEIVLASRYRHVLTDPRMSTPDYMFLGLEARAQIERVLRRKPTESEVRQATEHRFVRMVMNFRDASGEWPNVLRSVFSSTISNLRLGLVIVAVFALVAALAFRGGFMRLLGLETVTADGRPVSRARVLARTATAWAPILVLAALIPFWLDVQVTSSGLRFGHDGSGQTKLLVASCVALLIMLAGAVVAILRPQRGIQDWLAHTWIVPR